MADQGFDETAGFERYTIADPEASTAEAAGTLYQVPADPSAPVTGPAAGESGDEYVRRMGAQRTAENAAAFGTYGPVGRSPNDPISTWDMPADFTDAETAAFDRAITTTAGEMPGSEGPTWEEAAAYNRAAAQNLGTMTKAGMDSVESFESQSQMYQQVDDV